MWIRGLRKRVAGFHDPAKGIPADQSLRLGSLWEDHGLVFPDPWGRPTRRWTLDRRSFFG
jgi:hypothetical protein